MYRARSTTYECIHRLNAPDRQYRSLSASGKLAPCGVFHRHEIAIPRSTNFPNQRLNLDLLLASRPFSCLSGTETKHYYVAGGDLLLSVRLLSSSPVCAEFPRQAIWILSNIHMDAGIVLLGHMVRILGPAR